MKSFIGKNKGGKLHKCYDNHISSCNYSGQFSNPNYIKVNIDDKTSDELFCKKCFPNGNPLKTK